MSKFKVNVISRLSFELEADRIEQAEGMALNVAGVNYEVENKPRERFFYISYNGEEILGIEGWGQSKRTVIGHLAFSHMCFPSLLYITEQLVQDHCKKRGTPQPTNIVLTYFYEFATEQDFDDFTVGRGMGDQLYDLIRQN